MNSLYKQLYYNPGMAQMKNMVDMVKNSNNPQALIQNLVQQNPRVQALIQQYGGDPKTAFYSLAQQKGINPDDILNMLK